MINTTRSLSATLLSVIFLQVITFNSAKAAIDKELDRNFINISDIKKAISPFEEKGFKGIITVADKNGAIYKKAFGQAINGKAKYTSSTVVDIASVTKQFTAAAVLKLMEQGKISLNAPIGKYIGNVPKDKREITIHQLLTHTSGLKRHSGRDEEAISMEEFLKRALSSKLAFGVGEKYHYSNIGYSMLASLIEILSGQSFEDYLFQNLFKPAEMFSTGYERPDWTSRTIPELSTPYAGFNSPLKMVQGMNGNYWNLLGGGGILTTSEDMVLWHQALLDNKILTKNSKELLFTPYTQEEEEGYYYGYGWSIVPKESSEPLIWHNGMSFFGKAEYWRMPQSGFMIFVASHEGNVEPWQIAKALYDTLPFHKE
jgi:CubicO group peptidase (beta-lactamase class C family)